MSWKMYHQTPRQSNVARFLIPSLAIFFLASVLYAYGVQALCDGDVSCEDGNIIISLFAR